MRSARGWGPTLLLGLTVLAGCSGRAKNAQGPTPTTIDEAERMLAANRDALEAEGIVVPTRVAVAQPVAPRDDDAYGDQSTETKVPDTEADAIEDDPDAGGEGDIEVPPEPEPSPEAPLVGEADEDDYVNAPSADAPRSSRSRRRYRRQRAERVTDRKKRKETRTRCERVCDLADATCQLQERICGLADQHVTDVRYEEACARAELQGDAADRECQLCGGSSAWLDPHACEPELVSR